MYASTSETANANASRVWPIEARPKRHDPHEDDLIVRLQARDETAFVRSSSATHPMASCVIATMRMRLHRKSSPKFTSPSVDSESAAHSMRGFTASL
jgi:hypothetical protein